MIYAEDEIIQIPRGRLGQREREIGVFRTRPNEVGDHVETSHGWGIVVHVSTKHRGMLVQLAKKGPDLPKQEFPEWDLMRRADRLLARNRADGRTDR